MDWRDACREFRDGSVRKNILRQIALLGSDLRHCLELKWAEL